MRAIHFRGKVNVYYYYWDTWASEMPLRYSAVLALVKGLRPSDARTEESVHRDLDDVGCMRIPQSSRRCSSLGKTKSRRSWPGPFWIMHLHSSSASRTISGSRRPWLSISAQNMATSIIGFWANRFGINAWRSFQFCRYFSSAYLFKSLVLLKRKRLGLSVITVAFIESTVRSKGSFGIMILCS